MPMTGRQAKVQIELQQSNNEYLAKHGLRDIFSLLVTDALITKPNSVVDRFIEVLMEEARTQRDTSVDCDLYPGTRPRTTEKLREAGRQPWNVRHAVERRESTYRSESTISSIRPTTAPAGLQQRPVTAARSDSGSKIFSTVTRDDSTAQIMEVCTPAEMQVEIDECRRRFYEEQARVAALQAKVEDLNRQLAERAR